MQTDLKKLKKTHYLQTKIKKSIKVMLTIRQFLVISVEKIF